MDLLIRTAGELRLSDFLIWQSGHALVHFTRVLWPEFTFFDLLHALITYQRAVPALHAAHAAAHDPIAVQRDAPIRLPAGSSSISHLGGQCLGTHKPDLVCEVEVVSLGGGLPAREEIATLAGASEEQATEVTNGAAEDGSAPAVGTDGVQNGEGRKEPAGEGVCITVTAGASSSLPAAEENLGGCNSAEAVGSDVAGKSVVTSADMSGGAHLPASPARLAASGSCACYYCCTYV